MNEQTLREALIEKQRAAGWSYREMARELGIGYSTWYRVAQGQRGVTLYLVRKAVRRFPEFQALAFFTLQPDATNGHHPAPIVSDAA